MNFDAAFDILLGHEGGFVDHPEDPGGATRWGITARVAVQNGYLGNMRDFPVEMAKKIAKAQYWDAVRAEELPAAIRFDVFDTAYNSGVKQTVKLLQRAVGVPDDGVLGRQTMTAVGAQKPFSIAMRFNAERLDFLTGLATFGSFGKGWTRRIAGNLRQGANPQED